MPERSSNTTRLQLLHGELKDYARNLNLEPSKLHSFSSARNPALQRFCLPWLKYTYRLAIFLITYVHHSVHNPKSQKPHASQTGTPFPNFYHIYTIRCFSHLTGLEPMSSIELRDILNTTAVALPRRRKAGPCWRAIS